MSEGGHTERQTGSIATGKWMVFGIVAIGVFMGTLDGSIVNISLPSIARGFGVPVNGAIEWVVIGYLVMNAAFLLSSGRLSDMIGRKTVWMAGLAIFTGSSALCGAAASLGFLVAARALQGLGGALLFSTSPALLIAAFPPEERGRALGLNSVIVALGTSLGPTLGGLITATFSWRWIFYINLPIGIVGILLTSRALRETAPRHHAAFDPLGAFFLGAGLSAVIAALSFGTELGFGSPIIIIAIVAGVVLLSAIPFLEKRVTSPIIDLSLLRDRVFVSAIASLILSFLALFAVSFIMPFYLEQLRGFSPSTTGLLLTPLPVMIAIIAPISGSIADRTGSTRGLAAGGLLIACAGLILVGLLGTGGSALDIVWRLLVVGFGQALFQAPNNSALLGAAPPRHREVASGFLATGRVIGQSLSVALAGAVFTGLGGAAAGAALQSGRGPMEGLRAVFIRGFRAALFVCAAVALLGVLTSLVRGKVKTRRPG